MKKKFQTQVDSSHYYKGYDGLGRFITYYYQINSVIKTDPEKVLEIGIGNKTVVNYLREFGYKVIGCDFDKNLKPDVVADIRELPFKENEFDTSIACEILEHLPKKDLNKALSELNRVSKNYVIISVPYNCAAFEFFFSMNISFFKKKFSWIINIPYFFREVKINKKNKEHYWELGAKNMYKKEFRKFLRKYFIIEKEFKAHYSNKHYFFILKIK